MVVKLTRHRTRVNKAACRGRSAAVAHHGLNALRARVPTASDRRLYHLRQALDSNCH